MARSHDHPPECRFRSAVTQSSGRLALRLPRRPRPRSMAASTVGNGSTSMVRFASSARLVPKLAPPASPAWRLTAGTCRRRHPSIRNPSVTASATHGDAGWTTPTYCLMRARRRARRRTSTPCGVERHRATRHAAGHPCADSPWGSIPRCGHAGSWRVTRSCAGTGPVTRSDGAREPPWRRLGPVLRTQRELLHLRVRGIDHEQLRGVGAKGHPGRPLE